MISGLEMISPNGTAKRSNGSDSNGKSADFRIFQKKLMRCQCAVISELKDPLSLTVMHRTLFIMKCEH